MRWTMKTAFYCHLCAVVFLIAFGLTYLLRPEFMPYHAKAVGKSWSEVEASFRILILALMRVVGGGFLATACAAGFILFAAFRRGAGWALWAIPIAGLCASLPSLYVTLKVARNTPASPPWIAAAVGTVLLLAGLLFSLLPKKSGAP